MKTDIVYEGQSFWRDVLHRFRKNKGAVVGACFILFLLIMAIFAPMLSSCLLYTSHIQYEGKLHLYASRQLKDFSKMTIIPFQNQQEIYDYVANLTFELNRCV